MVFLKENLTGDHYHWLGQFKNPEISTAPDRHFFDRTDGNQILNLINYFGNYVDKLTIAYGQNIELLLSKELPAQIKSEIAAFNWLKGVYLY
jgi:hypothetical protein